MGNEEVFGQTSSDNCAGATTLSVNSTCIATGGTTAMATNSGIAACSGTAAKDVWYKFVATSTTATITLTCPATLDGVIELWTACGGSRLFCKDAASAGGTETMKATGLTAGSTYYLDIYDWAGTYAGPFTICIKDVPSNDNCSGAFLLQQNTSCSATSGAVDGSTSSGITSCSAGGVATNDVWYKFVATSSTPTITLTSATLDGVLELYGSCGGAIIKCRDVGGAGATENLLCIGTASLTVGSTYYVDVYDYGGLTTGAFTICVAGVPFNDDCSNGTVLPVNTTCVTTAGTTVGSTNSGITACSGTAAKDVWYKFVATATTATITLTPGAALDGVIELFSGCGVSKLACQDVGSTGAVETMIYTALTVGYTYYIDIYDFRGGANADAFTICVYSNPAACTAVIITTQPGDACASVGATKTFTVVATGTGGATPYQWQVSTDNGVTWANLANGGNYSNVTTAILSVTGIPGGFNGYQYRCACSNGTCTSYSTGAIISVGVAAPGAPTANAASSISSQGFTANWTAVAGVTRYLLDVSTDASFSYTEYVSGYNKLDVGTAILKKVRGVACGLTYYYRVWAVNGCGQTSSTNTITVTTSACGGDNCASPIVLPTVSSICNTPWYSTGGATASAEQATSCYATGTLDVWFSFVAPASGTVTVDMMGAAQLNQHVMDPEFRVYAGTCATLTCVPNMTSTNLTNEWNGTETAYTYSLTPGATYLVRADNTQNLPGAFGMCVTNGARTGADQPQDAIPLANYDCYPQDTRYWTFCSSAGLTNVGEPASPTCWRTEYGQTMWFSFVATTTAQMITTDWVTSGKPRGPDNRLAVYNSTLTTLMGCQDDIHISGGTLYGFDQLSGTDSLTALSVTGLTAGSLYYVRVDARSGIVAICTEPAPVNDACSTASQAVLNTIIPTNTTGAAPWTATSAGSLTVANPVADFGFSCAGGSTTQNILYWYFDCAAGASDTYYINQWSQVCDMSDGSQFVVFKEGLNCSTLDLAPVAVNAANTTICSNAQMTGRSLSAYFDGGFRYYIVFDGATGDECTYQWEITRAVPAPLPVELLDVTAGCKGKGVQINWITASERNNDHFEVERSSDGQNFSVVVANVKGAGNSSTSKYYTAMDNTVEGTTYYYRVKQVDLNGETTFSKTVSALCARKGFDVIAIVPVPSDNYVDVYYYTDKADDISFRIYDVVGQEIVKENDKAQEGANIHRLDLTEMRSGVYYLTVISSQGVYSSKIVKR